MPVAVEVAHPTPITPLALRAVQLLLRGANLLWTQSVGTFLAAIAVLVALRCGGLLKIHELWYRLMTFLLREKDPSKRDYTRSYLIAAEASLSWFCLSSIVCQVAAFVAPLVFPTHLAKVAEQYCSVGLNIFWKLCLGSIAYGLVNVKITRLSRGIATKSDIICAETSRQESQVLAVGQTARVLVVLAIGLWCLADFHINLTTVLSFWSMGGLAISLLSKGVFKNLIGSLTLYLTQPFTLGDWIQAKDPEIDGWVQSMGPYHTVVMRWDRRPVYIPNSQFTQLEIINASRMSNRRILFEIPLRLADLDKADAILHDIRDLIENNEAVDSEMHRLARLRSISKYAATIWVSCYTKCINLKDYVQAREDVLLGIKDIMFKNGTSFASTLEREGRRFDGTYTSASYDSGAVFKSSAAPDAELSATMDESNNKPSSLNLMTQKANQKPGDTKGHLTQEVQRLKDMQEDLWKRERALSNDETALQDEQEELERQQAKISEEQSVIEGRSNCLEELLVSLTTQEAVEMGREEEMDKHMEKVKQREDQADDDIEKLRKKCMPGIEMNQKQEKDKHGEQEKLAQKREEIKQEKKALLEEQKALKEREDQQQPDDSDDSPSDTSATDADSNDEDPKEQDKEEEDQAARAQRIAENLGGE